jgi:ankyrin repeat protein
VELLLTRGADREIRDDIRGGTPLGWAVYQGRDELARLLDPNRSEAITDTGLTFRSGEPVRLRVTRREQRLTVQTVGPRSRWRDARRAGERSPTGSSSRSR